MIEKKLKAVPAQLFTSNGTSNGKLTVANSALFKVKQLVIISSTAITPRVFQINRIDNLTTIFVGEINSHVDARLNISAYLTADAASIRADEQRRPSIPEEQIERHTYEEEPVVARRVVLVDEQGDKYGSNNPVPVAATVVLTNVTTPDLFNVSCPVSGTEYSQSLPANTARLQLKSRNSQAKLQLAWIPGATPTTFLTITPGTIYTLENVKLNSKIVYFSSNKDDTIVEILTWS